MCVKVLLVYMCKVLILSAVSCTSTVTVCMYMQIVILILHSNCILSYLPSLSLFLFLTLFNPDRNNLMRKFAVINQMLQVQMNSWLYSYNTRTSRKGYDTAIYTCISTCPNFINWNSTLEIATCTCNSHQTQCML